MSFHVLVPARSKATDEVTLPSEPKRERYLNEFSSWLRTSNSRSRFMLSKALVRTLSFGVPAKLSGTCQVPPRNIRPLPVRENRLRDC